MKQRFWNSLVFSVLFCHTVFALPTSGFHLPDSVAEMTLKYRTVKNLILLPVVINDSIHVNLILDTGCRNLILFGKKFQKLLNFNTDRQIQFSGLGSGNPLQGSLSLNNKVVIKAVRGENIPIVVVPRKPVFKEYADVHGVVGYEIFSMFEIELNPRKQLIVFRPGAKASAPADYAQITLQLVNARPVMNSQILIDAKIGNQPCDLMIDTGSCLGLLLKTTNIKKYIRSNCKGVVGRGLNGNISGYSMIAEKLTLKGFETTDIPIAITTSPWHNHASVGMEVLKDYVIIINYCKSYVCLKKIS